MTFDNYTIRLLTSEDLHSYYQMVDKNRSRLESFFTGTSSRTKSLEETEVFIKEMLSRHASNSYYPYLIVDNTNGQLAGFLDLKNVDWKIPKTEIGCYIDADYEGKGISTKAMNLFCQFCFDELKFIKLLIRTHKSNPGAIKVAERCGFQLEGIIRRDYRTTAGDIVDLMYYGKTI